ncbi:hypothetical protein [Rhizobium sp. SG570]|uniref:hypothetical protein n=1 Tax=Rhizobium sp. SG570 TaxID=2587113 RepID=UPI0017A1B162|nr:hypothetical protein [Rhizobium sp. SG570]NKJ39581.1 hypothetical protein [Rhizobium sp. SG570]
MDGWTLHWLEAAGPLGEWRTDLLGEFHAAYKILSARMRPPRVDILIQKQANDTIPETGTGGRAYSDTLLSIAVDPESELPSKPPIWRIQAGRHSRGPSLPA